MNEKTSPFQVWNEQARQAYQTGNFILAAQAYGRAAEAATHAGDELTAAEMKNNQSVAYLRANQPQAALDALSGAAEVFAQAEDYRRLGMTYANRASAWQALRRFKEAIRDYERAAEALEKAGEDQLRYEVLKLLSALYLSRLQLLNSVIALQAGLAGLKNPTFTQRLMKKLVFLRL
ncbi:MAG: hypothetical protein N2049_05085 [Anaerolineales bacterium]|nr:hypothetical protein [Anaerolineales bacterium]MCX7608578.1 hypothetical protein [Anaerolineales bacterium]MDW8226412.1 hypothetical protein [Anaerolineales bacterium]